MVSRLKNEKSLYKTQVRRLYHLLKEYKHRLPINSLPVYLVAETPEREEAPDNPELLPAIGGLPIPDTPGECPGGGAAGNNNNNIIWQDLSSTSAYSSSRTIPNNESPDTRSDFDSASCDPDLARLADASGYGCALVSQSRKASTVTTYLSNTSETNSWTGDGSDGMEDDLLRYAKSHDVISASVPNCMTSPVSDYSSYQDSLPIEQDELDPRPGGDQHASRTGLVLDLVDNDAEIPKQSPPDPPDEEDELDDYLLDGIEGEVSGIFKDYDKVETIIEV